MPAIRSRSDLRRSAWSAWALPRASPSACTSSALRSGVAGRPLEGTPGVGDLPPAGPAVVADLPHRLPHLVALLLGEVERRRHTPSDPARGQPGADRAARTPAGAALLDCRPPVEPARHPLAARLRSRLERGLRGGRHENPGIRLRMGFRGGLPGGKHGERRRDQQRAEEAGPNRRGTLDLLHGRDSFPRSGARCMAGKRNRYAKGSQWYNWPVPTKFGWRGSSVRSERRTHNP